MSFRRCTSAREGASSLARAGRWASGSGGPERPRAARVLPAGQRRLEGDGAARHGAGARRSRRPGPRAAARARRRGRAGRASARRGPRGRPRPRPATAARAWGRRAPPELVIVGRDAALPARSVRPLQQRYREVFPRRALAELLEPAEEAGEAADAQRVAPHDLDALLADQHQAAVAPLGPHGRSPSAVGVATRASWASSRSQT